MVFETEDVASVLADCCLFDWITDGKNLIDRYAELHPAIPGSDEALLLDAYRSAQYRLILPQKAVRGAGLECFDPIYDETLFIMDVAFSQTQNLGLFALATRVISLGDYW